jgi:hypothetical protein
MTRPCDLHQLVVLRLQVFDASGIDYGGLIVHGRIEVEVVQTAPPRDANRRR